MLQHEDFKTAQNGQDGNIEMHEKDFRHRGTNLGRLQRSSIWSGSPIGFQVSTDDRSFFLLQVLLLPLPYGGVHLAAWNFEFPTALEGILWKISAIVVASVFLAWAAFNAIGRRLQFPAVWDRMVGVLAMLCSIVCRLYIVAEAFASLRAVPIGVYSTPTWIQMIPHV